MRHLVAVVALVAVQAASSTVSAVATLLPAVAASAPDRVSVQVDRRQIDVGLGGRFTFSSTVRNDGPRSVTGLIAHLNILSTDPGTYVDPEDWSTHRTQFPRTVPSHGTIALHWPMQAVTTGRLIVYVAVVDDHNRQVTVSRAIEVRVAPRNTIDAGGILPLAVGVPAAVAVLLGVVTIRRRRE